MKIKRTSILSGIERVKDIPVDLDDWFMYDKEYLSIEDSMPYLTQADKDFILSGITQDEWILAFKEYVSE